MPKIICASCCKHANDKYQCTANKVEMSEHYVMTQWDGRQHFWKCKQYELDEKYRQMFDQFDDLISHSR